MNSTLTIPANTTPEISAVDALWALLKQQTKSVKKAIALRLIQDEVISAEIAEQRRQETLIKISMQQAFDELRSGKVKHNARNLFS